MTSLLSRNLHWMSELFWDQSLRRVTTPPPPGPTVLVIDDDARLLELMGAVLVSAGFQVLAATGGAKGLDLLYQAAGKVDVVLVDCQMPVMTGPQLLPWVRRLAPAARVVGVSGYDADDLPPEFRTGVDHLLRKPFTRNDLIGTVAALLPVDTPAPDCQPGMDRNIQQFAGRSRQTGNPVCAGK